MGLDAEASNFLSMLDLYDKPLVFLYLNNDLRVQTSLNTICRKLGVEEKSVCLFNAKSFAGVPEDREVDQYEDIFIKMAALPAKVLFIPWSKLHSRT